MPTQLRSGDQPEAERYAYDLRPDQIAQRPTEPRDRARLLDASDPDHPVDRLMRDLGSILRAGDLVVVNDTRVRRARLRLVKATGGAAEVLLIEPTGDPAEWLALVKPARRLPAGTVLYDAGRAVIEIVAVEAGGQRRVRVLDDAVARESGVLPLPPYIRIEPSDPDRYQTVYARRPGSVAAPTAGLHFTSELLDRLAEQGVGRVAIDLEVGLGTFAPMSALRLDDHEMHAERYRVDPGVWERVGAAARVIAVGTTVVRTLETVALTGELAGETSLFIRPGFRWNVVDALLTNFHMPRSTLLVLVEAFIGPRWREIYRDALERGYQVGSFGDAMFLLREESPSR